MAADITEKALMQGECRRDIGYGVLFLVIVLLPLLMVLADAGLRAHRADREALLWFEALDLSAPALWPAGTPRRHPETMWPGMDLRFTPLQPAGQDSGQKVDAP